MASSSSSLMKRLISRSILSRSLRPLPAVTPPAVPVRSFSSTDAPPIRVSFIFPFDDKRDIKVGIGYPRPSKMKDLSTWPDFLKPTWEGKETDDGLYLQFNMPGVSKESVKVSFTEEENILVIEGKKFWQRYNCRIQLLEEYLFNTNAIKSEIVNDVLNVYVPKFKLEERTDIIRVPVE